MPRSLDEDLAAPVALDDPGACLARAHALARVGRRGEARTLARRGLAHGPDPELLDFLARVLPAHVGAPASPHRHLPSPARSHGSPAVTAVAQDLAGTHLAIGTRDRELWLHDLGTGAERRLLETDGAPLALAFDPPGEALAVATGRGQVLRLDLASGAHEAWSLGRSLGRAAVWPTPDGVLVGSHGAFEVLRPGQPPGPAAEGVASLAPPAWADPGRRERWVAAVAGRLGILELAVVSEHAVLCAGDWTGRVVSWPLRRAFLQSFEPDGAVRELPVVGDPPAVARGVTLLPGGAALAHRPRPSQGPNGVVIRRRGPEGWGPEEHLGPDEMARSLAAAPAGDAFLVGGEDGSVYRLHLSEEEP